MPKSPVPRGVRIAPRGYAVALMACGVALVPWTVYLASTLPGRYTGRFYRESWTVFDAALLVGLLLAGALLLRGSQRTSVAAAASGTLLFVDAWFDVSRSGVRSDFWMAFLVALLIEIPLGVICWRLAPGAWRLAPGALALRLHPCQPSTQVGDSRHE